jgi:hypothetical protein
MNADDQLEFASQTPKAQRASVEPMTGKQNITFIDLMNPYGTKVPRRLDPSAICRGISPAEFSAKLGISIPHTGVSYRY